MQAATDHKDATRLVYFAFDLLFIDGENLTALPLVERKDRLKKLLRRAPKNIYFVDHVIGNGQAFYDATCKHAAEGIVSKRIDAPYKPGDRGIWRKVKCINEDEFVVVGFTNPEGRRPYLGALLLGYYTPDGDLIYAGRAGTGMNEAELKRLYGKLKPLETKKMTVSEPPPRTNRFGSPLKLSEVHWIKPTQVAQVRYLTWTADGFCGRSSISAYAPISRRGRSSGSARYDLSNASRTKPIRLGKSRKSASVRVFFCLRFNLLRQLTYQRLCDDRPAARLLFPSAPDLCIGAPCERCTCPCRGTTRALPLRAARAGRYALPGARRRDRPRPRPRGARSSGDRALAF